MIIVKDAQDPLCYLRIHFLLFWRIIKRRLHFDWLKYVSEAVTVCLHEHCAVLAPSCAGVRAVFPQTWNNIVTVCELTTLSSCCRY